MKFSDKLRLIAPVIKNWLSYKYNMAVPVPAGYVILGMTYRCNCRCVMCNIWQKQIEDSGLIKKEIGLDILYQKICDSKILKGIPHIDITGGEPFLRDGVGGLISRLFLLKNINTVTLNSNGILTDNIINETTKILETLPEGKLLSISISIDGVDRVHDEIRGIPGCFKKAFETIEQLNRLRERYPGKLELRSNAVIQPANIDHIEGILEFWKRNSIKGMFAMLQTPCVTHTEGSSYNVSHFSGEQLEKIKMLPNKGRGINCYIDHNFTRPLHCFAGYSAVFIDPFGDMYPCNFLGENKDYVMGNIKTRSIDEAWSSKEAYAVREAIKKCPYTTCWNGCEIHQTIIQYELLDIMTRICTLNILSWFKIKGLDDFE